MTVLADLQELLRVADDDLEEAAAAWLEARAAGHDTEQAAAAITEAERAKRRLERKIQKLSKKQKTEEVSP